MYISHHDLKIIRKLILDLDVEACGFLIENETPYLQLYLDRYGQSLGNRGSCQLSKYTKYIWHTHPSNLIAYPSPEDIYTILKYHSNNKENNFPHTSIVFTNWGIWSISFPHVKFTLDANWLRFLHTITDEAFHGLWNITESGTKLGKNARKHIDSILKNVVNNINREPVFNNMFSMSFMSWKEIGKTDYHLV